MSNLGKQIMVTPKHILKNHYFTKGYKDKLNGFAFNPEYDNWDIHMQHSYERGRMYAAATNGLVPPKGGPGNKQVTYSAQRKLVELYNERAFI